MFTARIFKRLWGTPDDDNKPVAPSPVPTLGQEPEKKPSVVERIDAKEENAKPAAKTESKEAAQSQLVKLGFSVSFAIPLDELELGECLSEHGGTGFVCKADWRGMTVAVKKLSYKLALNKEWVGEFLQECRFMQELQKLALPSVVEYAGCANVPTRYSYNIVMEYLPGGTVISWMQPYADKREHTPWSTCYKILGNTAAALLDLHNAHIVHGDLKWDNVMLLETGGDKIKLVDFGQSCQLPPDKKFAEIAANRKVKIGTSFHAAPEIKNQKHYGYASDIFSFGGMMYVMAVQSFPFAWQGWDSVQLRDEVAAGAIARHPIPESCPKGTAKLIRWCWQQDPEKRPTAKQLLDEVRKLPESDKSPAP